MYNDIDLGQAKSSGNLRKRIQYNSSAAICKINKNKFYPIEKKIAIKPGKQANQYSIILDKLPVVQVNLINKETNAPLSDITIEIN